MSRPFEIITFDCYGTLIDWEEGIHSAFTSIAGRHGWKAGRDSVLRAYATVEPEVEKEYRTYREVLAESACRVAAALGWAITREDAETLAETLPDWTPFPDTNPALERLRESGYRLGILSNIDDDLLAATRSHFTVDFDLIVTAMQVRSYKPGGAHFETARERIGTARWLHAAQSNFHDIVPTNERGIPNAWINRRAEQALPGGEPAMEFPDLASFATAMTAFSA